MAADDDILKRRKARRAEEDEAERVKQDSRRPASKQSDPLAAFNPDSTNPGMIQTEKLDELIRRAEVMIEQVHNLYNTYVRGIDSQHPRPRRAQLEQLVNHLMMIPKPTPAYRFKFNSLLGSYNQYRDRWDKMMKDLEDGKIVRPPRMGRGPIRRGGSGGGDRF